MAEYNLYFMDADAKQHLVAKNVEDGKAWDLAKADLAVRRPNFVSQYQRYWYDNYFRYWIDYGSHTEFYILQEEKQALNLAEDEPVSHGCCNGDYCEL